ncbi:hypothetical protein ABIF60_005812 [Bradyrhizobium japonicum]
MRIKLSAVAMIATIVSGPAQAAALTDAEATFLDQLVIASVVLEQRCDGYEVDGSSSVQLGARLLGSPDAAMAMIDAYAAAIKARDGESYDPRKFRPEVSDAAPQNLQARPHRSDQKPEKGLRRLWRGEHRSRATEAVLNIRVASRASVASPLQSSPDNPSC